MRRFRYLVSAALLLVAVFFFYEHQSEAYDFQNPQHVLEDHGHAKSEPAAPIAELETPKSDQSIQAPPQSEESPPDGFPQSEQSVQDMLPSEPLPPAANDIPILPDVPPAPDTPDNNLPPPSPSQSAWHPDFPFQEDLNLDLPISTFEKLGNYKPHNYDPNGPKTYTYATFMATRNPSPKDPYFMAIHSLIYRILWSPRSRTTKYPFVVFVADFVTPQQRQLLSAAGAVVRELSPLEWTPNVPGVQERWKDLFAKLNMWNETEFSRILFLDADAFPTTNIDDMFDIAPEQTCISDKLIQEEDYLLDGPVCEPYIFSGVPQDPFNTTDININVGSIVFTPSSRMHMRLLQNYPKTDRYNCLMAEQAFLNWQFNINGAFPGTALDRTYGGAFPQEDDEGKLKVVHEKLWREERRWMKEEWEGQWAEMLQFYASDEFAKSRANDGTYFR